MRVVRYAVVAALMLIALASVVLVAAMPLPERATSPLPHYGATATATGPQP